MYSSKLFQGFRFSFRLLALLFTMYYIVFNNTSIDLFIREHQIISACVRALILKTLSQCFYQSTKFYSFFLHQFFRTSIIKWNIKISKCSFYIAGDFIKKKNIRFSMKGKWIYTSIENIIFLMSISIINSSQ